MIVAQNSLLCGAIGVHQVNVAAKTCGPCRLLCGIFGVHCPESGSHDRLQRGLLHPGGLPCGNSPGYAQGGPGLGAFQPHC